MNTHATSDHASPIETTPGPIEPVHESTDEPAVASVEEAPGEAAQDLAGGQWALCLDIPSRS